MDIMPPPSGRQGKAGNRPECLYGGVRHETVSSPVPANYYAGAQKAINPFVVVFKSAGAFAVGTYMKYSL